jgi:hypothetical protein
VTTGPTAFFDSCGFSWRRSVSNPLASVASVWMGLHRRYRRYFFEILGSLVLRSLGSIFPRVQACTRSRGIHTPSPFLSYSTDEGFKLRGHEELLPRCSPRRLRR